MDLATAKKIIKGLSRDNINPCLANGSKRWAISEEAATVINQDIKAVTGKEGFSTEDLFEALFTISLDFETRLSALEQ